MIYLKSCPKKYTKDLDKAIPPEDTLKKVKEILKKWGIGLLKETKRIDINRLGIPVYISIVGHEAKKVMPTRKQMGKGSSEIQAEVSAIMELVERFSFFSFWQNKENFYELTWSEAEDRFGTEIIPFTEITKSTNEDLPYNHFKDLMDLIKWKFTQALMVEEDKRIYLPADWFRRLNEFNGSSAGNTFEESILQGGCELVERHVCAIIDNKKPPLPTIDSNSFKDVTLKKLYHCFKKENIKLWIKDFSVDMGIPTVGVLAYDPTTFPKKSEIVFTAGTATSPEKAVIRALTEVAQLAGDFCTGSNYEASGLSKYKDLEECRWVMEGEFISIDKLPDISNKDIYIELLTLSKELEKRGFSLYSIDMTHPKLKIPCNYNIVPGFRFKERSPNATIGMFVGRAISEDLPVIEAEEKIKKVEKLYPDSYFVYFYKGLIEIRKENYSTATLYFKNSLTLSPPKEEQALIYFYIAYSHTKEEKWDKALNELDKAIFLDKDNYSFYNLKGVSLFKLKKFSDAIEAFNKAIDLDSGSAIDYANIGICYKCLNRPVLAKKYLNIALEIEPDLKIAKEHLENLKIHS